MTTFSQDKRFLEEVIGTGLLETAINWIKENLEPEDVFDENTLEHWAEMNDYQKVHDAE